MQRIHAAAAVAAILGVGGTASAADVYSGGMKDGPVYVPANTWTGFYFGANGGYGWDATGSKNLDVTLGPIFGFGPFGPFTAGRTAEPEGGFGGAQIGYNWQRDRIVFGIESDIQISDISGGKTSVTPLGGGIASFSLADQTNVDWFGTLRGRLGYVWDSSLVYFTGGLAYGKVNELAVGSLTGVPVVGSIELGHAAKSDIQTGYVLGGGIEFKPGWGFMSSPNWTVKAEYQYINLGSERLTGSAILGLFPVTTNEHDNAFHTVRVGINYHIPNGYEPLK
jgi:outer membrane immunogenic protein